MRKEPVLGLTKHYIITALLVCGVFLAPAEAISAPPLKEKQNKIKEIESTLSREKQKLRAFDSQEKGLLGELSDLEQKVAKARESVDTLKKKIELQKIELEKLEARLIDAEKSLRSAEDQISKRLVALYKYAKKGYVKILANARDFDQFWQRVEYLKCIMQEDQKTLEELTDRKRKRNTEVSRMKEQFIQKEANYEENRFRLASLENDLERKVIRLMRVHKEKEFYETAVKELELAAQDLRKTLLTIEKKGTYQIMESSRFKDFKGRLPWPMEGKVIQADRLLGPTGMNVHKGIFIESDFDTEVRAIFSGRIDYSGKLKGYGEVVIINHGSRFFTISAQFSRRKKVEGELVESGEIIGLIKSNESSESARLYFEIREGSKGLDPLSWLKTR